MYVRNLCGGAFGLSKAHLEFWNINYLWRDGGYWKTGQVKKVLSVTRFYYFFFTVCLLHFHYNLRYFTICLLYVT